MLIETVSLGIVPMSEVLPDAFGPEDLLAAAEGRSRRGREPGREERARSGALRGSDGVTA
jgi:hypothetical protein